MLSGASVSERVAIILAAAGITGPMVAVAAMAGGWEPLESVGVVMAFCGPLSMLAAAKHVRRRSRLGVLSISAAAIATTWLLLAFAAAMRGSGPIYRQMEKIGVASTDNLQSAARG